MSWQRINLADDRYATPPEPPAWCGLVYRGRRHLISGPPEAAKTLVSWLLLLAAIRDGATVAAADFEMGPEATRLMLVELGFTLDEIAAVRYFEPETEPTADDLAALQDDRVDLVLIDALAGAFNVTGLDDHKRTEVEQWQATWTRPLYQAGIASLATDHVVKNAENRGSYSIGSERKLGGVDVHLGIERVKALARGGHGLYRAHVHKDRPGYLRTDGSREIELHSDPDTHHITWTIRAAAASQAADADHWQPTVLMSRVADFLSQQAEPVSRAEVERNVTGKSATYIRKAIDELTAGGYILETRGSRGARLVTLARPYPTSSDLVQTSSDDVHRDLVHLVRPLQGDEVRDEDEVGPDELTSSDEVERLFARHRDIAEGLT